VIRENRSQGTGNGRSTRPGSALGQARTGLLSASVIVAAVLLALPGCGGQTEPPATTPGQEVPVVSPDTYGERPHDASEFGSGYRYIFRMTSPPNDNFAITERAIYLWFWPDTSRVSFRMENRLGTQMKVLWDQCRFTTTEGITYRTIHEGIPYDRRNLPQDYTLVPGLGRYNDWIAPVDLLDDPTAAGGGEMRLLFPTDVQAMSFPGKSFWVDFVVEIDNTPRTYRLVFTIDTVSPPQ
jgi:hypothetical protein